MKVREAVLTQKKMLKDDDRSRNMYENKGNSDTMPDKLLGLWSLTAPILHKLALFFGHSKQKCANYATIWVKDGPQIGSSTHRPTDPSTEHGIGFRWPNDLMVRWPDHYGFP
jgi:hypothetical protein